LTRTTQRPKSAAVTEAARKLVSLKVSPWSERAKWALDHHGLAYEVVEHFPVVGERRLRQLVGPTKLTATVPVLLDGDEVLSESWDIALYADRVGRGTKLIPRDLEADIKRWTGVADEAMQAGRALVLAAMLATPGALDEGGPRSVPRWLRPMLRPIARRVMHAFARKYGLRLDATGEQVAAFRVGLDELRKGVGSAAGAPFLLGSFSYADIAMATLLQGVAPVADRFIRLGPGTRRAWTQEELASEYGDLVAWRDAIYEKQRRAESA
jgi:glutathione S-transferase